MFFSFLKYVLESSKTSSTKKMSAMTFGMTMSPIMRSEKFKTDDKVMVDPRIMTPIKINLKGKIAFFPNRNKRVV